MKQTDEPTQAAPNSAGQVMKIHISRPDQPVNDMEIHISQPDEPGQDTQVHVVQPHKEVDMRISRKTGLATFSTPMATRWAASVGIVAIGLLYFFLPGYLTLGPSWLLPLIEGLLLIAFLSTLSTERENILRFRRVIAFTILGFATLGLMSSVVLLINNLPHTTKAFGLLRDAGAIWASNILVFALWYWELDGGGPRARHQAHHKATDFMFPQQVDGNTSLWVPQFFDYVFLAFNTSTAFSPTDTYPLTKTAKALMMTQAIISFVVIALFLFSSRVLLHPIRLQSVLTGKNMSYYAIPQY
jgi:hypothetical protein